MQFRRFKYHFGQPKRKNFGEAGYPINFQTKRSPSLTQSGREVLIDKMNVARLKKLEALKFNTRLVRMPISILDIPMPLRLVIEIPRNRRFIQIRF